MNDVQALMTKVLVALIPAGAIHVWLFGPGLLINCTIAVAAALAAEALMLKLRGRPLVPALLDLSAPVTAVLLAFALPPLVPWWIPVVGTLFAIVVAKQLYGGIGFNLFNPAMAGYVVLLISFPIEMTRWPGPFDGVTAATPLDQVNEVATIAGGWEWLSLAVLAGGLWLLSQRVIRWPIPVAVLGSLTVIATVFWLLDPGRFASPAFHLAGGATMLCAFFIATDPVTAATTPRGRIVYGVGIGTLIWVLRNFSVYPDGVAFAVLLMNMAAPALDHFLRPRGADAR
ncbi:MAG: RnfABCDGE type electron transport complex subunit D [Gammaproteobacteria bacterium]